MSTLPTKNSENVEKSGDLFRSAEMSPACSHFSRNSSHGSPVRGELLILGKSVIRHTQELQHRDGAKLLSLPVDG